MSFDLTPVLVALPVGLTGLYLLGVAKKRRDEKEAKRRVRVRVPAKPAEKKEE